MKIGSLYVTQTAVIGLSDVPLAEKGDVVSTFDSIFKNRKCFQDAGIHLSDTEISKPCANLPYINNIGQFCFNKRAFDFFAAYSHCGKQMDKIRFGYDKGLKDQRMNFLCFSINRTFKMLAQYGGRTMASGKIFLHIYPSGYIVVHLAVYRRDAESAEIRSERDILELIHETKPWLDGKWKWKSRFGCLSLGETFQRVFQSISASLFAKEKEGTKRIEAEKLEWTAGVAMKADLEDEEIRRAIMGDETASHFVEFRTGRCRESPGGILAVKKKMHCYFASSARERNSILHSFWKINHIREFVLYKKRVYDDYLRRIQKDRNAMRDLTLRKDYILKIENLLGKDFYKSDFFEHTQALDQYVLELGSRYRKIYTMFSDADGFGDKRAKLNKALEDWEKDIAAWNSRDPGLMKMLSSLKRSMEIYKSVLSFLRKL